MPGLTRRAGGPGQVRALVAELRPALERLRPELVVIPVLLFAGVFVAAVWRLTATVVAGAASPEETAIAVDSTLGMLALVAGGLTGTAVLLRPGARPALRVAVTLVASGLASTVAWLLGDRLGTPALGAPAAAYLWPVATAVSMFVGAFVPQFARRLEDPPVDGPVDRDE